MPENRLKGIYSRTGFRYLLSGATSFIVENLSFAIFFYSISLSLRTSNILSICVALVVNFLMSKYFVFSSNANAGRLSQQFAMYLALVGFNLIVSTLTISVLVEAGIEAYLAKLFITTLIVGWTYIIYNRIIFKK